MSSEKKTVKSSVIPHLDAGLGSVSLDNRKRRVGQVLLWPSGLRYLSEKRKIMKKYAKNVMQVTAEKIRKSENELPVKVTDNDEVAYKV